MAEPVCIRCGGALVDTGIYCPTCRAEEDQKTDDARLQRLTELARKVWPDAAIDFERIAMHAHPRALDALEAALLVLDMSPERAARLLHGMRTYGECPCAKCAQERALASEKKC